VRAYGSKRQGGCFTGKTALSPKSTARFETSRNARGEERYRIVSEMTSDFSYGAFVSAEQGISFDWITMPCTG